MEEIFQQIGALLLGATPTILLFVALVLAYQFLVQGPLSRALAERRARTEGAIENAHKAISRAEARAAEYAEPSPGGATAYSAARASAPLLYGQSR